MRAGRSTDRCMKTPLLLVVAALLAAGTPAQAPAVISPAGPPPGSTNNSMPFGRAQVTHQQIHSANSFSSSGPVLFDKLRFDISVSSTSASIDVEIFMADAPHDADAMSSVYANNIVPGTEVNVFQRRQVSLPPRGAPWAFEFPLDTPYLWNGGDFTWRTNVHDNSAGGSTQRFAVVAYREQGASFSRTSGCASALGTAPADHSAIVPSPGGVLDLRGNSYVAGQALPATLSMGLSNTQLGTLPLPLDLGVLGAAGCVLTNDMTLLVPTTTNVDATGSVALSFPVPNAPQLSGAMFYTQYLFLQPGATPLGLFTSNGTQNTIGRAPGVSRVYGPIGGTPWATQIQFGLAIGLN